MELSKDAQKLIHLMYKNYLEKRHSGLPKSDATVFGSSQDIHDNLLPDWIIEDINETCRELDSADMLDCFYADGDVYYSHLSDSCIVYMENRFKKGMKDLLSFIAQFIP